MRKTLISAFILACLILFCACDSSNDDNQPPTDGDASDGDSVDTPDGDQDGDLPDGDSSDGDDIETDGDDTETDGDSEEEIDSEPAIVCRDGIAIRDIVSDADETFDIGPYLMQPKPDSIIIMWRTHEEVGGTVLYGLGDEPDQEISQPAPSKVHEILIDGLTPDTRYSYQVRSGDSTSRIHHFYTAVKKGQPFNFAVIGDTHGVVEIIDPTLSTIGTTNPYWLLGVGDHTNDGSQREQWKNMLFDPARAILHELPFYAAMGNHERNGDSFYELYSFPHPEDDQQHESCYSFTYGNAYFLVIDSNKVFFDLGDATTKLSEWVHEQVKSPEAQAATWRFALSHEPGYSEGWSTGSCHYEGYLPIRNWFFPLLVENGFHAYFNGHMHGYERGMVDGLAYVSTGGGGGGLDAWCKDFEETTVAHYEHNFLTVEAGCDSLRIEALYPDGTMFDWIVLDADNPGVFADKGPVEDLGDPTINTDSPSYEGPENE